MASDLQQARAKAPVHSNAAKLALRFTLLMGSIAVIAIAAYLASQNNTVPLGIIGPIVCLSTIFHLLKDLANALFSLLSSSFGPCLRSYTWPSTVAVCRRWPA
jgi:hypothetical protein